MFNGHSLSVVVPAYNEESHVGEVIDTLPDCVDRAYVVDDCSTDDTWSVIQSHVPARERSRSRARADGGEAAQTVVPIRHERNRGVGGAIKTGYLAAIRDGTDIVAVMGGDGQMDPDLLPDIVAPVADGRAAYAKGNRLCSPSDRSSMPTVRQAGNRMLSALTRLASGYWGIGDPQNGYTAASTAALERSGVDEMYEFYGYCNDLLVKLNVADCRVADVPMPAEYGDETSHIDLRTYVPRVSGMLARNFFWRLRRYASDVGPAIPAAYLGGIALSVPGLAGVLFALLAGNSGLLALSSLVFLVATVALVAGVALDRRHNEELAVVVDN
ncbi:MULTISPECIES: glycosyltransferase family 2 protein [Halomicrobium]|uniref:Glycosyl transferase family 2 n=2 Tax=Halomicrobium mukohataei TaxID=57705 RepID=C7NW25_HALMD|nr:MULTISPECIES: glycosyltransferase family 2 protein [Halomicrobium]ACV48154.1 glycosyl transferase family 2 [Halomicrobium mukohataei DSM 12286]QCD66578.1 glycosyltransferase family 2 protein [Halomicrobium mukohataei]QFR21384.1 glycosyltransferase [Halomicrobium sp. ZPS1]